MRRPSAPSRPEEPSRPEPIPRPEDSSSRDSAALVRRKSTPVITVTGKRIRDIQASQAEAAKKAKTAERPAIVAPISQVPPEQARPSDPTPSRPSQPSTSRGQGPKFRFMASDSLSLDDLVTCEELGEKLVLMRDRADHEDMGAGELKGLGVQAALKVSVFQPRL